VEPLPRNLRVTSPLLSLSQPEDDLKGVKGHVRRDLHGLGKRGENKEVRTMRWIVKPGLRIAPNGDCGYNCRQNTVCGLNTKL